MISGIMFGCQYISGFTKWKSGIPTIPSRRLSPRSPRASLCMFGEEFCWINSLERCQR